MARADIHNFDAWLKLARQSDYQVKRLARELNVSQRTLQRYTQQVFSRSPQDWLDEQRMRSAGALLKEHRCVKSVAFLLGFRQVSHFSLVFKLHYGVCPTAFLNWVSASHSRVKCSSDASTALIGHYR